MLHLASETDPGWADRALAGLDEILIDHAHLEKKAAGNAIMLLFRYPDRTFLMEPLSALAREELLHFEEVLRHLTARGIPLKPQRASPYASRLRSVVRMTEPGRLVDTLICSAVIEARSCERMTILARVLKDPTLVALYEGLLASEARHHTTYLDLAARVAPEAEVRDRLEVIAHHEAEVLAGAPFDPRFHNR